MKAPRNAPTVAGSNTIERSEHATHIGQSQLLDTLVGERRTPSRAGSSARCARSTGKARLTAPRNAVVMCANWSRGDIRRAQASVAASGHATVTHVSRLLDHHQPEAESHTSA
jgi:hypothetical protein